MRSSIRVAALMLLIACLPVLAAGEAVSIVDVHARARSVVSEQLGVEPKQIEPGKPLRELGMDDLDLVELIMALEEEFDIAIPDEAVDDEAVTTHRLAEVVVELLRKKR